MIFQLGYLISMTDCPEALDKLTLISSSSGQEKILGWQKTEDIYLQRKVAWAALI